MQWKPGHIDNLAGREAHSSIFCVNKMGSHGKDSLIPSTYFGAGAGSLGAILNGAGATLKGKPVVFFTVWGGAQWFALGSVFWFVRSTLQREVSIERQTTYRQDLLCSTVGGTAAGLIAGSLRGRANILPGAIIWGVAGLAGQASATTVARLADQPGDSRPLLDVLADKPWWPLKRLSDADYENETREKLIAVEAEIALIDEKIDSIRQSQVTQNPSQGKLQHQPRQP